jgi:hypothetical protein
MSDTEHMVHGKAHGVGIYLAQVLTARTVFRIPALIAGAGMAFVLTDTAQL